jgi:hypothetical protein
MMAAELIEIEGREVQYQHIDRANETAIMAMYFEDYGYMIEYYLLDEKNGGRCTSICWGYYS